MLLRLPFLLAPLLALSLLLAPPAFAETAEPPPAPQLLRNVNDRLEADPGSGIVPMGPLPGGRMVFGAGDAGTGREPWVTDGTPEGTFQLAELCPGRCDGVGDQDGVPVNGRLAFLGAVSRQDNGSGEFTLFITDGTRDGTRLLFGELYGPQGWFHLLAEGAERLFAVLPDPDGDGFRVVVTDGTSDGTVWLPRTGQRLHWLRGFVDGRLLYQAGMETWSSDGTAEGTRRLTGFPEEDYLLVPIGPHDAILLVDQRVESRAELWRTDGTEAGTWRFGDVPALIHRTLTSTWTHEGRVLFNAWLPTEGDTLWITDGTEEGTRRLLESRWISRYHLALQGGTLYHWDPNSEPRLVAVDLDAPEEVVAVDGLPGLEEGEIGSPSALGDGVVFGVRTEERETLWYTDLTPEGTRSVLRGGDGESLHRHRVGPDGAERLLVVVHRDDAPSRLYVGDGEGRSLVEVGRFLEEGYSHERLLSTARFLEGDVLVFAGNGDGDGYGEELWRTDGTPGGTRLVENLALPHDDGDSDPTAWVRVGNRLLFFASDGEGTGLWETDGTEAGTRRLHRVPGTWPDHHPAPRFVLPMGDLLYFVPGHGDYRNELMVADLARGELRSLLAGAEGRGDMVGVAVDGRLLFATRNQLVVTDGTPSGTLSLGALQLQHLVALDDGTALGLGWGRVGEDGELRRGLWHVDGTPSGFRLLMELPDEPWHLLGPLVSTGDSVWFTLPDPDGAPEDEVLWFTDGTAAGTRPVLSLPAAVTNLWTSKPEPVVSGGRVFVVAGSHELWVGEESGEVRRIATPASGFDPDQLIGDDGGIRSLTPFRGGVLFAANDTWYGEELMWSDGTAQGTRRVADLQPGSFGSSPRHFVVDGDRAFFVAFHRGSVWVWITDGTAEGTARLFQETPDLLLWKAEMAALGDRLLFTAEEPRVGLEPWVFPLPGEIVPLPSPSIPEPPDRVRLERQIIDWGPSLSWYYDDWTFPWHTDHLYFAIEARRFDEEDFRLLRREPGDSLSARRLDELERGVPYLLRVRAVNAAGSSVPSPEVALYWPTDFSVSPGSNRADPCRPEDPETLCLLDEEFRVRVAWRDPRTGRTGQGVARPLPGNDRTGTFWFFDENNVELVVKVLDGTAVNDHYWVLAGGLTDLEYWLTVSDTVKVATRTYHSPPGDLCGTVDDRALDRIPEPGVGRPVGVSAPAAPAAPAASVASSGAGGTDVLASLALLDGRFRVDVDWRDPRTGNTGTGVALPGNDTTGYFWFFRDDNVELVVKVLDGTPVNGHHWFFYGGLTDVEYTIRVTNLDGSSVRTYHHPAGDVCGGADTAAFLEGAPSP